MESRVRESILTATRYYKSTRGGRERIKSKRVSRPSDGKVLVSDASSSPNKGGVTGKTNEATGPKVYSFGCHPSHVIKRVGGGEKFNEGAW